ncbi:hypothetical protein C6558_27485 [Ensifer sp. NM-2]|nr:hypothetical protein C6558_27485 [Ensifer sp. NM-2]
MTFVTHRDPIDTPVLRKERGAFFTPPAITRFISKWEVHSNSKCDMPMISMVSPWRFWDVTKLFAAESGGSSPPLSLCRTQGADQ